MRNLLIISVVLFFGCSPIRTAEKARGELAKISVKYPEIPAKYCADKYPVVARTDSTGYLASKRAIDSLISAIAADSVLSRADLEMTLNEIRRLQEAIKPQPNADCDSLTDAIYRYAAAQSARANRLEIANKALISAAKDLRPVHDTVVNTAQWDVCQINLGYAVIAQSRVQAEADKWRAIARKRFWIIVALGTGVVLWLAAFLYRKYKKV